MSFVGWVVLVGVAWIGAGALAVAVTLWVGRRQIRRFPRDVRVIGSHARLVKSTPHRERNGRRERRADREERAA